MSVEKALFWKLTDSAALRGLVGRRVYPNNAPQKGPLPYVVYERAGSDRGDRPHGGLVHARFRFEGVALTPDGADAVREAIRGALDGEHWDHAGTSVRGAFLEDSNDEYLPSPSGGENGEHSEPVDFRVHYQEAV